MDLKVLVTSFNREDRSCYVGNPRENVFSSSRKSFAKVGYYESYCIHIQLVKGYHPLPPELRQEKGTGEFWFGSGPCGAVLQTCTFPGSSRASSGEASQQPEAHPCWHCLMLLSQVSRNKLQTQQPSFQMQQPRPLVFALPPMRSLADGWGLQIGMLSRKFCEGAGESQTAF